MVKKFTILIEDDWELLGNGLGNVASHQYLPSLMLMKLAKKLDIKFTFMVEVAQQLEFVKHQQSDANIRLQKNLWDNSVLLMKDYGFDVQLHLHPQWTNGRLDGDIFQLNNNWNIGRYDAVTQNRLIHDSVHYLHNLIKPYHPTYQVIAFKGGSWGLQPSETLFHSLENEGIKIVMGVRKGMNLPWNGVNYNLLEEEFLPYYPAYNNIQQISSNKERIFIIPLQTYKPGFQSLFSLGVNMVRQKLATKSQVRFYYQTNTSRQKHQPSPVNGFKKLRLSLSPYHTHLKIGNQPFGYLKNSFNKTIARLQQIDEENIPILIESHTKQFPNHYGEVEKFLGYIKDRYSDLVQFEDLTGFYENISSQNNSIVRTKS